MTESIGTAPEIAPVIRTPAEIPEDGPFFAPASCPPPPGRTGDCLVLLPTEGFDRARELLDAGHGGVLLGEAALKDSRGLAKLAAEAGAARVGVLVPVKRMQVSWTMDTESNADFRFMRPSLCEPSWEIVMADGRRTGTIASWWLGEVFGLGVGFALLRADISDDADLNICAGLAEQFGERIWFSTLTSAEPRLDDWVRWGHVRRLALARPLYDSDETVLAWREQADASAAGTEAADALQEIEPRNA